MSSFMSGFAAFAIRCSGKKKMYADPEQRKKYFEKLGAKNDKPFKLFPFFYRSKTETVCVNGVEILYFNRGGNRKIVYLHGGAYCEPPLPPHFMLCAKLARKTGSEIIFPLYKRAPKHTFTETYAFLEKYYRGMLEDTPAEQIVFMGDSAGGGLALAFCEYLKEAGLPKPAKIIAISPWLDVSMDTPFDEEIDKVDPNLQRDFLKEAGKLWAGDTDVHDYRLSPMFGDFGALAPSTVYYGTHEALITDARNFRDRCMQAGAELDYREYEGMNHDFVLYPIPEAARAQKEIIETLKMI